MRILLAVVCGIPANCVLIQFKGDWAVLEENECHLELNIGKKDFLPSNSVLNMRPCIDPQTDRYTVDNFALFGPRWVGMSAKEVETERGSAIECTRHSGGVFTNKVFATYTGLRPKFPVDSSFFGMIHPKPAESIEQMCNAIAFKLVALKEILDVYSEAESFAQEHVLQCIHSEFLEGFKSFSACVSQVGLTGVLDALGNCLGSKKNQFGARRNCLGDARKQLGQLVVKPPSVALVVCLGGKLEKQKFGIHDSLKEEQKTVAKAALDECT